MEDILTTMRRLADDHEVAGQPGHYVLGSQAMRLMREALLSKASIGTVPDRFKADGIEFNGIKVVEDETCDPDAVSWVTEANFVVKRPEFNVVMTGVSP